MVASIGFPHLDLVSSGTISFQEGKLGDLTGLVADPVFSDSNFWYVS